MNHANEFKRTRLIALILTGFLAACGGGGGGGGGGGDSAAAVAARAAALAAAGPAGLSPDLMSGATYGVVAGPSVTLAGPGGLNQIVGDLAVSPGTTKLGPGLVSGATHLGNLTAAQARQDMFNAYTEASTRVVGAPCPVAGDLQAAQGACNGFTPGPTYRPGLYNSSTTLAVTGTIVLDALGNPDAVFIFRLGSALTTATNSNVTLTGGAKARNVWWITPAGATLGVTSHFEGSVLADAAATLLNDSTLTGRLFSNSAAVTVNVNSVITVPGP
jgi:hypothetical protein